MQGSGQGPFVSKVGKGSLWAARQCGSLYRSVYKAALIANKATRFGSSF